MADFVPPGFSLSAAAPRPVFNSGSTGGSPKAATDDPTASVAPFIPEGFSAASSPGPQVTTSAPTAPPGFSLSAPEDIEARAASDPSYVPNQDELFSLYQKHLNQWNKPVSQIAGDVASGIGTGLLNLGKSLTVEPIKAIGENIQNTAQNGVGSTLARDVASVAEGGSQAATGLLNLGYQPLKYLLWDKPLNEINGKGAFKRWSDEYLQNLAQSRQGSNVEALQSAAGIQNPVQPLPATTDVANTVTGLALGDEAFKAAGDVASGAVRTLRRGGPAMANEPGALAKSVPSAADNVAAPNTPTSQAPVSATGADGATTPGGEAPRVAGQAVNPAPDVPNAADITLSRNSKGAQTSAQSANTPLTPEAVALLASGAVPTSVDQNLMRIAGANGISVGEKTAPQIVNELRAKSASIPPSSAVAASVENGATSAPQDLKTKSVPAQPQPENLDSTQPFEPNTPITDTVSTTSPNTSPANLVQKAIQTADDSQSAGLSGRVLSGAGQGAAALGGIMKTAGALPRKAVQSAIGSTVGKLVPEDAQPLVEGMLVDRALDVPAVKAALLPGAIVEGAGRTLATGGNIVKQLAEADKNDPFGRLHAVAQNTDAPMWMRAWAASRLGQAAEKAATAVPSAVKNAGAGAAIGGGSSLLAGQSPEQVGEGTGSGAGFGAVLGAMGAQKSRIFKKQVGALSDLVKGHLADGVSPDTLRKIPDAVALEAATAEKLGLQNGAGLPLKVRFLDATKYGDMEKASGYTGSQAFHSGADNTIYLNTDKLSKNDSWGTLYHELGHPLFDSLSVNQPDLQNRIGTAITDDGKTLQQAKQIYGYQLIKPALREGKITDPLKVKAAIDNAVAERDAMSQQTYNDPDHWIYSELFADAARNALAEKGIVGGTQSRGILEKLKSAVATPMLGLAEKLGVTLKQGSKPGTVIPGFENVVADPSLRGAVYKLLRAQRDEIPGLTQKVPQGIKVTKDVWGKSPAAPLHDLGNGRKGNDFVEQGADGRIVVRPKSQTLRIIRSRQKEINDIIPDSGTPLAQENASPVVSLRRTPGGKTERSGTKLPPAFYDAKTVGSGTKAIAKDLEGAISNGEARTGFYQQIGSNSEDWKASVARDTGNVEAQLKDFVPYGFLVDKKGNTLVRNYSLTAFERKAAKWASRKGPLSLEMWDGDVGAFKKDVQQYLVNHAEGSTGDSSGLGTQKKDIINAFLVGGNRTFESKNPLRAKARGEDRQGIIRSYRLDRLETVEPLDSNFKKPDYGKQLKNFAPAKLDKSPPEESVKLPIQKDGTGKAWILPTGEVAPLKGGHADYLNADPRAALKNGLRGAAQIDDSPASKAKALDAGYGRINLNKGTLIAEFNEKKFTPKIKDALLKTIEGNIGDITRVDVSLFNKGGKEITGGEEANVWRNMERVYDMDVFNKHEAAPASTHGTASDRVFNRALQASFSPAPNEEVRDTAATYMKGAKLPYEPYSGYAPTNPKLAKEIADWYDGTTSAPKDPKVKAAYDSFAKETVDQYKAAQKAGMKFETWNAAGQPYKDSKEMAADVRDNKHLWFFPSEGGFGSEGGENSEHPLLADSGVTDDKGRALPVNDVFRAIHDYYGHAKEGYGFGPRGEYNAFISHAGMYSDKARPAMAAETMGQNSWVNFGRHLRDSEGNIPGEGEPGFKKLADRPFAEQKVTVMPADLQRRAMNFSPDFHAGGALEKLGGMTSTFGDSKISVIPKPENPVIGIVTGLSGKDIASKIPEIAKALKKAGFQSVEYHVDNSDGKGEARERLFQRLKRRFSELPEVTYSPQSQDTGGTASMHQKRSLVPAAALQQTQRNANPATATR